MKRPLTVHSDIASWFASEDGKHYRGHTQDMDQVMRHVRRMDDKVNNAPRAGNRSGWEYRGSIPMAMVIDYCTRERCTFDQWARDEGGVKTKFLRQFKTREFAKFWRSDMRRA